MRMLLAKVFFNFDLELVDNSDAWLHNHKTYLVWEKLPLMVHVSPRV